MVVKKLEVWRGSGAGSKRNKVGKFNVPFKKVSLCFRGFIFDLLYFIIGKIFSIHDTTDSAPYSLRPTFLSICDEYVYFVGCRISDTFYFVVHLFFKQRTPVSLRHFSHRSQNLQAGFNG